MSVFIRFDADIIFARCTFDASGREVSTLLNSQIAPGSYEFEFSAKNLTSGVYFYRLQADNFTDTKKLVLVK